MAAFTPVTRMEVPSHYSKFHCTYIPDEETVMLGDRSLPKFIQLRHPGAGIQLSHSTAPWYFSDVN